jgi:Uma2 family endonuclease
MRAAEFFQLPETVLPTELIDGELIEMPSPKPQHQILALNLVALLLPLSKPGQLLFAPMDVYLDELNVVQPDLMWIAPDSACVIGDKHLTGAPDLVIEILSPGSSTRDRREKFELYQRFGVREYWLVDPGEAHIEVYARKDGSLQRVGVFIGGESIASMIGEVRLDNLF